MGEQLDEKESEQMYGNRLEEERYTGLMESLGSRSIRGRERERERERGKHRKNSIKKILNLYECSLYIHVFNEHVLYKS